MSLIDDLIAQVPEGEIEQIRVGLHWTAVVVNQGGDRRCGLASTLSEPHKRGESAVPEAGELTRYTGRELIKLAFEEDKPVLSSVGVATLNALLPDPIPEKVKEEQAESLLTRYGPADMASEVLPQADVVAITSMALINRTLESLLELCSPEALVVVLGPSTPMSSVLFEYGVDILAGSQIIDIEGVLRAVCQGGNFRQVHRAGVKLIAQQREGLEEAKVMAQL
jgi:uncharacterized protein (DUF4213/DUF364 family)